LKQYIKIAEDVESVNARLQEYLEKSRKFNQREFLVGKELKDYSRLNQINKDF